MHVDCLCCQGYDSVVGNVRKACVYCLVALHEAVGEAVLQPYLSHVSETKVRGVGMRKSHDGIIENISNELHLKHWSPDYDCSNAII